MKTSLYNWAVEDDGRMIIFNGATGCMAEVEREHEDTVGPIVAAAPGQVVDSSRLDPAVLSKLAEGGFLVPDDADERELLRQVMLAPRLSTDLSYMCVVPTTRCNFACPYCTQETESGEDIRPEVEEKILEAIGRSHSSHLSLTFYGGEPLLIPETCCRICSRAIEICGAKDVVPNTLLVTNGYLLDEATAIRLRDSGVAHAQVTIDGNRAYHDGRRVLKDGSATFERIVRNVIIASSHMRIDVRMNVDDDLHRESWSLYDVEQAFLRCGNVQLHVAPTRWRDDPDATQNNMHCVCHRFPQWHFLRKRLEAGVPGCCAVALGARVVLPDGDFVLCWDEVGTSHPDYGSILSSPEPDPALRSSWMRWDPYGEEPCKTCRYLPTCRGSCPRDWLETGSPFCEFRSEGEYIDFIKANYRKRAGQEGGADSIQPRPAG